MSIREPLELILARYEQARAREPFGRQHPLWEVFRSLRQTLEDHPAVQQRPTLAVNWSAGQGSWAKIPWVALMDTRLTRSTQQGVYCVYLFRQDMSGVYLALNQGAGEPKRQLGRAIARSTLRQRAADLRAMCGDLPPLGFRLDDLIELRTDSELGMDYEASTVAYRLYEVGELPEDRVMEEELEAVLRVYDRYLTRKRSYALPSAGAGGAAVREPRRRAAPAAFDRATAMRRLVDRIAERRFVFEPWQVAAYVTALRTKPLVILAGVTGTGKSRLPSLVAEGTGGAARLIPVRPDWTESSDLLGYTDLQGAFRPGVLLQTAREAMGEPQRHWVCVLDEMNLARVEQYFAEVLSRIEDRSPAAEGGYSSGPLLHPTLTEPTWSTIGLPPNLALVGTVNMDESAHGFSRKVLDRAFTLELSDVDLASWEPAADAPPAAGAEPWPTSAWYPRATRLGELRDLTAAERQRIGEVIDALVAANRILLPAQLQVGYRSRDEVALFTLHAAEVAPLFTTRSGDPVDPLDLALQMKVLPRVIGGSGAVRHAVLGLLGWAWSGQALRSEADARTLLEEWERAGRPSAIAGARFPYTAARLCLMWERFLAEGYTSFWL